MMRMSDAQQFYVVGIHGAPTPETAPHGVMWRSRHGDGSCSRWYYGEAPPNTLMAEWAPLPPPPTEQAPAPEPVKRWRTCISGPMGGLWVGIRGIDIDTGITEADAAAAADALNALDRDGVAWGPGRPMEELPETGRVMVWLRESDTYYIRKADYISTHRNTYECWWPLPLPGEATT